MDANKLIKTINKCHELNEDDKNAIITLIQERTQTTLDQNDEHQENISDSHNPLPEGVTYGDLSPVAQASYDVWEKLDAKKQKNVSYIQEDGEWEIRIGSFQMQLTNATAEKDSSNGIFVHNVLREDRTYFSQAAAIQHAQQQGMKLPTNHQWEQMANLLGGYSQLRDVLQIPLVSDCCPDGDLYDDQVGHNTWLWSADSGGYLYVFRGGGGGSYGGNVRYGLAVRLLRYTSSDT